MLSSSPTGNQTEFLRTQEEKSASHWEALCSPCKLSRRITFLGSVTSIKDALVGSLHRTVTFIENFRVADCSVPSVRCGPWFDRFRHVTQEQNVLPPESFSNVGAEVDGLSSSSTLKASDYACKQQYC
jgi:hypothetical protein